MMKKLISLLLVLIFGVLALVGCGSTKSKPAEDTKKRK